MTQTMNRNSLDNRIPVNAYERTLVRILDEELKGFYGERKYTLQAINLHASGLIDLAQEENGFITYLDSHKQMKAEYYKTDLLGSPATEILVKCGDDEANLGKLAVAELVGFEFQFGDYEEVLLNHEDARKIDPRFRAMLGAIILTHEVESLSKPQLNSVV